MKELNTWQNHLFRIGAIMILTGFVLRLFLRSEYNCWVIALGVVLFSSMQMLARYEGSNFVIQRLRRQQIFSDFLFLMMAGLMILQDYESGPEWTKGNAWILCLVVGTILQLYTAFRIPKELEKNK